MKSDEWCVHKAGVEEPDKRQEVEHYIDNRCVRGFMNSITLHFICIVLIQ